MKSFIAAMLMGICLVFGCTIYMNEVEEVSDRLNMLNKEMIDFVKREDYENAKKTHKRVDKYLKDKTLMLAATGNHTELDQMQIYLSQVIEYIEAEQRGDALAFCKSLEIMFEHLPKNYRLRAENIL